MCFIHDAHLGRAFLFLDLLAEHTLLSMTVIQGFPKGWFPKLLKRVVLADVPPERKPERGYIRMSPPPPGTKTGTRVRSHVHPERKPERGYTRQDHPFTKPPFYLPASHGYSMSLVWGWNEVGDVLKQVSSSPFCTRPFWWMPVLAKSLQEREVWPKFLYRQVWTPNPENNY